MSDARKETPGPDGTPDGYRLGYLKLKSALYDRVTGLPALPVLFHTLRTLLDGRRWLGVVHLEIAELDRVESIYGWQVFDRIVARVATLLRQGLGRELPADALLAVNGVAGDRFVAFIADRPDGDEVDGAFLGRTADALRRRIERDFAGDAFAGLSPRLCVRAGHALVAPSPFFRFERSVLAAVEQAREQTARIERRRELSWGEELQHVIRTGAINVVFQPVIELATHHVLGHEAFARGPRDTMFETPRAMFALSERLGLAGELDRRCLEAALTAFGGLVAGGKLFLNLLPTSLADPDRLERQLAPLLRGAALAPADVVVEVSERGAEADVEPFVELLQGVKQRGFALAIDDIGTGRTGQSVLERLRPDYLKLDVALVRGIDVNGIQQEVLRSLVGLAARIDAEVIAEGVESDAEAITLCEIGARYGQGHRFAAPAALRPESPNGLSQVRG